MKVVLATDHLGADLVERLRDTFPDTEFAAAFTPEDQMREVVDAEVFMGWPSREVFAAGSRLKWVHCVGTGVDNVGALADIAAAGTPLTNALGPHTEPMADHVMLSILSLAHVAPELWEDKTAGTWDTAKYAHRMVELNGSTMGLYGLGGIGRAITRRALGFGMEIVAVDPDPAEVPDGVAEVLPPERLDDMVRVADWLVIACPLTARTRGSLDARRLGLLKRGAYLVLISRGGILDEEALAVMLKSGHLAGAALDATLIEPLPPDSPLWALQNVLLSPHSSALTPEMYEGRRQIVIQNLRRYLAGQPFLNVVDAEAGY
ncbi:MAG: D-2-hydroxyacid dehydrogenase [Dehalococcoidia bacterium]